MANVAVVPATAEHIADLAPRMRGADRAEVWASSRATPLAALETSVSRSPGALAGMADGRVQCIFGVSPLTLLCGGGVIWMLGSEDLPRYAVPFLRRNGAYISTMFQRYETLTNYVDARNTLSIRWLRWLGFAIMSTEPYGPFGLPFHRFEMRAERAGCR